MAFWNRDQIEALQNENKRLEEQAAKYHRELIRCKNSGDTESGLKFRQLEVQCSALQVEVEMQKEKLDQSISLEEHERMILFLREQNSGLRKTIEALRNQPRRHNERGAGRKSRIRPEHVDFVKQEKKAGKSLAEIARLLSEQGDRPWSKSTIKYILTKY